MSKTTPKYLITASTYVGGKTLGEGATKAQPKVIETDAPPSRTWLPINRAAQVALEALGVSVPVVPPPGAKPAPRETSTMLEASQRRTKLASEFFNGPRLSDTSPVGDPVVPPTSKLVTPKE